MGILKFLSKLRPPSLLHSITHSKHFEKYARKVFKDVDVDSSGHLDAAELYICLLLLYDQLNSKLPAHLKVPTKVKVLDVFGRYDADNDGKLDEDEFLALARALFLQQDRLRDSLVLKVGIAVLLKIGIWPAAAIAVKKGLERAQVPRAESVPTAALSHGLEAVTKAALAPFIA